MKSKLELRIEAVKLAINVEGVTSENIVETSKSIAEFVLGTAELPESYNTGAFEENIMQILQSANTKNTTTDEAERV